MYLLCLLVDLVLIVIGGKVNGENNIVENAIFIINELKNFTIKHDFSLHLILNAVVFSNISNNINYAIFLTLPDCRY